MALEKDENPKSFEDDQLDKAEEAAAKMIMPPWPPHDDWPHHETVTKLLEVAINLLNDRRPRYVTHGDGPQPLRKDGNFETTEGVEEL